MTKLQKCVFTFLKEHCDESKPVLLALSGGPDSMALLHLLIQYRSKQSFSFAIAHVNHNWRAESNAEALILEKLASQNNIPFHGKNIDPATLKGNLEDACRNIRLRFFNQLCAQHGYQAVVLGHHADDQAETVLKRILEGADLTHLHGLLPVNYVEGVTLWRPLLAVNKSDIMDFISANNISAFNDSTNLDPKFLRGRMRLEIIPSLSKAFGKEIKDNLCQLAQQASQLNAYASEHIQKYLDRIEKTSFGVLLDLSDVRPKNTFELNLLVRIFCEREDLNLGRELVKTVSELLIAGKANRKVIKNGYTLFIDRYRLFLMKTLHNKLPSKIPITEGKFFYGNWFVTVKKIKTVPNALKIGWKAALDGSVEIALPAGDYHLGPPQMNASFPGNSSISKWWNDHKIPVFLRNTTPVIWNENKIHSEFLTKFTPISSDQSPAIHIKLDRISAD